MTASFEINYFQIIIKNLDNDAEAVINFRCTVVFIADKVIPSCRIVGHLLLEYTVSHSREQWSIYSRLTNTIKTIFLSYLPFVTRLSTSQRKSNKMQECIKFFFISYLCEAQHVSGDKPPTIMSLKLH